MKLQYYTSTPITHFFCKTDISFHPSLRAQDKSCPSILTAVTFLYVVGSVRLLFNCYLNCVNLFGLLQWKTLPNTVLYTVRTAWCTVWPFSGVPGDSEPRGTRGHTPPTTHLSQHFGLQTGMLIPLLLLTFLIILVYRQVCLYSSYYSLFSTYWSTDR